MAKYKSTNWKGGRNSSGPVKTCMYSIWCFIQMYIQGYLADKSPGHIWIVELKPRSSKARWRFGLRGKGAKSHRELNLSTGGSLRSRQSRRPFAKASAKDPCTTTQWSANERAHFSQLDCCLSSATLLNYYSVQLSGVVLVLLSCTAGCCSQFLHAQNASMQKKFC